MSETGAEATPRLRWQCRRGMRELDELLQAFLDRGYSQLDASHRAAFEDLLATPDNKLLEYLMGRRPHADRDVAHVIQRIRHAARP